MSQAGRPLRILYLGHSSTHTTSRHRADALRRIGHEVIHADPFAAFGSALRHQIWGRVHFRTGYRLLQGEMRRWLMATLREHAPDAAWVDGGELFGSGCMREFRALGIPAILFNVDDPTGYRDGRRFDQVRAALPGYTLAVTVRRETENEMRALGAAEVMRVWRAYDEVAHAPWVDPASIPAALKSEIVFLGTWMRREGRGEFLCRLIDAGLPVSLWGERWQKSEQWDRLKPHWRGGPLAGREYVGAIQGSKVVLGMLSKGNRDLHTQRSSEIPFAGGLLCGERTSEHSEMYRDTEEAVFWSDAEECAEKCRWLLDNPVEREAIRAAGMRRVRALKVGNEDIARLVLKKLQSN